ncbi:uncharacterized protein [Parasteatoda tepidariorum]|uniref:uncharacterized protein n=1 Tax=Parasteatoda tepidariorum TaxID=114398 RepID=UPI00077FD2F6|nr:uncharacterized protein LOC107452686 [Parasteatoda tepidariorum]
MKCSPFSRGLRKGSKHMHRRFMKHLKRRCMDGYESSSSSEDSHRHQTESDNDTQQRIKHDHGMKHGMRHGHGMMHRMRHSHDMTPGRRHGMMHGMRHDHGMMHGRRHGHGMMHEMRHDHGMMHERRHGHGMINGMRHGHSMKHLHVMEHGKRHDHAMEHRMKHRQGMKHKMHHGHGRKHKMGHGPGMHHKLRRDGENVCPANQNEERPLEEDTENMQENSEGDTFTFYEPKTSAQVMSEDNRFQITLETSYYQPEEVSVKIADGQIDVSAMHESMENGLYEFHEMYRSFNIPNNVNPEVITARLNADGKLIIEAACNEQEESSPTERDIPVIRVSE